jgi:hypothetical protein
MLLIFIGLSYYIPTRPILDMEIEITCSTVNSTTEIASQSKSGVNYICTLSDEISKQREQLDRDTETIRQYFKAR